MTSKSPITLTLLTLSLFLCESALAGPNYKYKKYIPTVSVIDAPVVNPTDPNNPNPVTPQFGILTLSSTNLALPRVNVEESTSISVIASNLSDKPVTASAIGVSGGFSLSYACATGELPALINPGQSCSMTVTGVGSSASAKVGTLSLSYQSGGSIAASVTMPRSLVPSLIEGGVSQVLIAGGNGLSTEYGSLVILNSGEQPADIKNISIQGQGFVASQNCLSATSSLLASNTTCTITVSGVGDTSAKSAILNITYDDNKLLVVPISQNRAINNEGGVLNPSPTVLSFEDKDVGAQDSKIFTITNTADWGTTVKSVSVPQNSGYTTSITCPGAASLPAVLEKGQACTVTVGTTYQTSAQSTTVSVDYNNTTLAVAVSTPVGLAPTADLSVGSLSFGYFNPNSSLNVSRSVTVTNNGSKPLDISGATLGGVNPSAYTVSNGCSSVLGASSSCSISVTALTSALGDYSAVMSVQTSVGSKTVALSSSIQALSISSTEMVAGSSSSYLTATTTAVAPALTGVASVKLYDQTDTSLLMTSSGINWNAGSRTLTSDFNSITPAAGSYVARFLDSTGQVLAKGVITVYNPITLRVLDSTNTSTSQIAFGTVTVASQKTLRIANIVNAKNSLNISNVTISAGPFTLSNPSNPQGGATCSSLSNMIIPSGGACDIVINLPATEGTYSSGYAITMTSNATASSPLGGGASVVLPVTGIVQSVIDPNYGAVIALLDASSGTPANIATNGSVSNSGVPVVASPSLTGAKTLYFNGSTSINFSSTQSLGAGDFTIEGWYYYIGDSNGFYISGITGAPSIRSMGGVISIFQNDNGADYRQSAGLTRNGWTHLAYVRKNGNVNLFINGVLQSAMAITNNVNYTAPFSVKLGGVNGYAYNVNAYYDQFRVTKAARYTSNFTPAVTPYASQPPANGTINLNVYDTNSTSLSTLAFGSSAGGVSKTFRLNNSVSSLYSLAVSSVSVTNGSPFTITGVSNPTGGATCTAISSMSIPPGGSCDVAVSVGTQVGTYNSGYNITIASNATNSSPVSGASAAVLPVTATVTGVAVSPTSISFSNVGIGTTSANQLVTVTNNTGSAVSGFPAVLTGTNAALYGLGGTCQGIASLPNGSSCTVTVSFTPTDTSATSAAISVGGKSVALTGAGVSVAAMGQIVESCKTIKTATPSATSGVYTLSRISGGVTSYFSAYCEMSIDGGGWTLMFYGNYNNSSKPDIKVQDSIIQGYALSSRTENSSTYPVLPKGLTNNFTQFMHYSTSNATWQSSMGAWQRASMFANTTGLISSNFNGVLTANGKTAMYHGNKGWNLSVGLTDILVLWDAPGISGICGGAGTAGGKNCPVFGYLNNYVYHYDNSNTRFFYVR